MGNENSSPLGEGGEGLNGSASVAGGMATADMEPPERASPDGSVSREASGKLGKLGSIKAAPAGAPKPDWRRPGQNRVSTVDVRQAEKTDKARPESRAAVKRTTGSGAPPTAAERQAEALERESAQRMEASKKELVGKIKSQIKTNNIKDVNTIMSAKVPQVKQSLQSQESKKSWFSKLSKNKAATLEQLQQKLAAGQYLEPMSQEDVGSRVENSMGDNLEQFAGFQGAVHNIMQTGVPDEALDQFFMDEEQEKTLTTYQKWQIIRHAAEQVLAVYANRSNSQWIEDASWTAPRVIDTSNASASMFASTVDQAVNQGQIAMLFIDDGRLAEVSADEASPLVCTDLWQAIKELAPHKVPSGQRLERLSVAGRHLLHAAVSVEMWYGPAALKQLKVVLAVDCDVEYFLVSELPQWGFFGLQSSNVVILPLPRFHGFAQDNRSGHLAHVKGSPRLMLGTGYAMFLLNSPAEGYTLSADGSEPQCLAGSALEWLRERNANWLYTGLFSDIERLRPEGLLNMDFLAAAYYAADRQGANMAMEIVLGEQERDARNHDSVVLARQPTATGQPNGSGGGGSGGAAPTNCNLRVTSMRTAKTYQLLRTTTNNPHGFYVSSHRYFFKIQALQSMLVDAAAFHADVYLQGFYAYAMFDISDLTTFREANCAAILSQEGVKGPLMSDIIYGKDWLAYAANVLTLQDKVKEFRKKAIQLVDCSKLSALPAKASSYKDKDGFNVLLVVAPEHTRVAAAAIRMSRLFVTNIVDRLHVIVIAGEHESRSRIKDVLDAVTDKELEFNGQLVKEVLTRSTDVSAADLVEKALISKKAQLCVVPSERLCSHTMDLGQVPASIAMQLARNMVLVPLLIVKANTVGRYLHVPAQLHVAGGARMLGHTASAGVTRETVNAMVHLDGVAVGPMVEYVSSHLAPGADQLFLTKTQALEKDGQLSMRSKRVFVQARMSVGQAIKVEERAYAAGMVAELPKAVEAESIDLLAISAPPDLAVSKEVEALLLAVRTSVLVHRQTGSAGPAATKENGWT